MRIAAIDFETANNYSDAAICAAGLAIFEDWKLTETLYWLIRPPRGCGWFWDNFIEIHGITHKDVLHEPEFPAIAHQLLPRLATAEIVIAHWASFDVRKLQGTLEHFQLPCPKFEYLCTCQLAKRVWPGLPSHGLEALAEHIGHSFQHHHARADAETAGYVLLAMMKDMGVTTPRELAKSLDIPPRAFP